MSSAKNLHSIRGSARNVATMIFGRNAAKQLELELGCSSAQAWRIVSHGYLPGRLAGDFWDVIERRAEQLLLRVEAARRMARSEREFLRERRMAAAAGSETEGQ